MGVRRRLRRFSFQGIAALDRSRSRSRPRFPCVQFLQNTTIFQFFEDEDEENENENENENEDEDEDENEDENENEDEGTVRMRA